MLDASAAAVPESPAGLSDLPGLSLSTRSGATGSTASFQTARSSLTSGAPLCLERVLPHKVAARRLRRSCARRRQLV